MANLDLNDISSIRTVINAAFDALGRIDVVVNNAGYGLMGAAEEYADSQIEQQLKTNLLGPIQVTRAVLPFLRRQGGGRIIQLASMGGQIAFPGMSIYHASKWAIEGFVESVAQEVAPFGIEFTIVEPGVARTNFGGGGMVSADPLPDYDATPVGEFRRAAAAGLFPTNGDPQKMAHAIINSVERQPAPRRLTLGSDAYAMIRAALVERLAALDTQRDIALSTDFDDHQASTATETRETKDA